MQSSLRLWRGVNFQDLSLALSMVPLLLRSSTNQASSVPKVVQAIGPCVHSLPYQT